MGLISKVCLLFRLVSLGWKEMVLPRFLEQTYQIVDDPANKDIISWNDDGSTFIVWNTTDFARVLLKKHFSHEKFFYFHNQLNNYGFRKVNHDRWEFCNKFFQRGQKSLLHGIRRKGAIPAVPAVTEAAAPPLPQGTGSPSISGDEQAETSSGSTSKLIEENERLRKENSQLNRELANQKNRELSEMSNLCNNIYALISNYVNKPAETGSQAVKLLDLLPLDLSNGGETSVHGSGSQSETEKSQWLFGATIGVKRTREGDEAVADRD